MYHVPNQEGKLAIVTGANSGTGEEVARRLAQAGASVVMAVRSLEKGEAARAGILAQHPGASLTLRHLDLADLASVRTFSEETLDVDTPVDILVNNGGVMAPRKRVGTVDGHELQFATNFLGHFALTLRLLPLLRVAAGPVVCTVSSPMAAFGSLHFDDLQWQRHYRPYPAYAQSKLADLLFAQQLARLASQRRWDLMSNAAHPGFTRTNLMNAGANLHREQPWRKPYNAMANLFSQRVEHGAEPLLYAATSPDALNGAYYGPSRFFGLVGPTTLARVPRRAQGVEKAEQLWRVAEELTGLAVPVDDLD